MPLVCSCRDVIEIWLLLKGGLPMLQDSGAKHPEWGKECLHVLPRAERMEGRRFPGRARRGVQPCGWKAQGAQERETASFSLSGVTKELAGPGSVHETLHWRRYLLQYLQ